jgi:hypothetical protein
MQENEADRERRLRELASKLLFTIERRGSRFALYRAQIEVAVREISKEFVAEMVSLRAAFEKTVQELTREAKSRALVAMASLKVPDFAMKN